MADDWKKLHRELKILRAKKKAGGWLHPKDAERLTFLEERLGDAAEVERIKVSEPVDSGPKTTTSDDHYATEVSEKLLDDAKDYEPQKYYEKEQIERPHSTFEARDTREGKQTFKQEGLSSFAIDATEDMREGEISLADAPQEEEEAAEKIDHHRPVYAKDESERLTKKPSAESANPYALDISDGLAASLEKHKDPLDSAVPDSAATVHEVAYPDDADEIQEIEASEVTQREEATKNVGVPVDLEGELTKMSYPESAVPDLGETDDDQPVIRKSYDLPVDRIDHGEAQVETRVRGADSTVHGGLSYDLMRQALEAASEDDLAGELKEESQDLIPEDEPVGELGEVQEDLIPESEFEEIMDEPPSPAQPATTVRATSPYEADTAAFDRPDFSKIDLGDDSAVAEAPAADTAVLIPDPPPEKVGAQVALYSDEEPTGPEVEPPPQEVRPDELPMPPPPPPSKALSEDTVVPGQVLIPPAPEPQAPEPDPEPSSESLVNIEVDLEESQSAPDEPSQPQAEVGADIDQFWTDNASESTREAPVINDADALVADLDDESVDDLLDLGEDQAPLPSLSVPEAAAPSPPEPEAPLDEPAPESDKEFLNALFSDSELEAQGDRDGIVPAYATSGPSAPRPKAAGPIPGITPQGIPQRPEYKQPVGTSNDLRGPRKATVHYKDGVTRRGVVGQVDTNADTIRLDPPSGSSAPSENLVALSLKTIFLMLPRGSKHPEPEGLPVRLVLIDGRALDGSTPDYDPQRKSFTLFPKAARGNIERIIVFNDAIKNIWFEDA